MTTSKIIPSTSLPWKKFVFSTLLAGTLAVLPSVRATLPSTTSSNLTTVYANGGAVSTTQAASTLTVTSTAPITVLNWGNFWDGTANGGTSSSGDTINFTLPSSTSSILNEISGVGTTNPTTINGSIMSNGKVTLLNANGIVINGSAVIQTAGFYASTLQENVSYFEQNGILQVFTSTPPVGTTNGDIDIEGGPTITTIGGGGDVRLAGNGVYLAEGTIKGNVYLVDTGFTNIVSGQSYIDTSYVGPVTIASTTVGGVTVGGNLTISGHSADTYLADGSSLIVNGNLVMNTGGGDIYNDDGVIVGGTTSINTVATTSYVNNTGALNGSLYWSNGSLTSGGAVSITTGTGSGTGNGEVELLGGVILGSNPLTITGGNTYISDTTDTTLTLGNVTIGKTDPNVDNSQGGILQITTTGNIATQNFGSTSATPAVVTMSATADNGISLTADSENVGGKSITFNGSGAENFTTLAMAPGYPGTPGSVITGDKATISTTGNLALNTTSAVAIPTLSLTSTGGAITQGSSAVIGSTSGPVNTALTVNAPTVTLNNASNNIASAVLQGGATGGISLTDSYSTLTIANKTNAAGNVTITESGTAGTNGNVALGSSNADSLTFGGNLTINLTGTSTGGTEEVTTGAGTVTVTGNTTITSTGDTTNNSVTLGNSAATPVQAYTFTGPISVAVNGATGGAVSIFGNSALNLGAITTGPLAADTLKVQSAITGSGNTAISNPSGVITVGSAGTPANATFIAGTSTSPSNIQIGGTTNPAVINTAAGTGAPTAPTGIYVGPAYNVSITNSVPTGLFTAGSSKITGTASITQTGNGAASAVWVGGNEGTGTYSPAVIANLSVADTGSAPTGNTNVDISSGNVTLTNWSVGGTGAVSVSTDVTAGGTSSTPAAGDVGGSITLGSGINDTNTGETTLSARGSAASIADTANSPVSIYGPVYFASDGPINVSNNTANSLGPVSFELTTATYTPGTSNNSNITYTEGGGVNVQLVKWDGPSYNGTVSLTSVNSGIYETSSSAIYLPTAAKLNLTAQSANGAVVFNSSATNEISAPITLTATGNSTIYSSGYNDSIMKLSGINVWSGTLTVSTGTSEASITEQPGTTIYTYSPIKLVTDGGTISLNNSGNQFSAVTADSTDGGGDAAGAAITIKKYSALNIASINAGNNSQANSPTPNPSNVTLTSEQSTIFETGNSGIIAGGQTTLNAPNGSSYAPGITMNAAGNAFGTSVLVTTNGSATLADSSPVTTLAGGTNVTGTLTVNNTATDGVIEDNGTTGNVTAGTGVFTVLTSGNGYISFTGGNNNIANVELKAGTGTTTFYDNSSVAILPGTAVSGPATISSGGGISMTTSGPVSFLGTLALNASGGNITFTNTSALFNAQVTAVDSYATGDVNFAALSKATNFNGIAPNVTTNNNATLYQPPGN